MSGMVALFNLDVAPLDGKVHLTADARIDAREDLKRKLAKLSEDDSELILHAYEKWGEDCVNHLIGDFAFAIWDSRSRRLFCARDHFGVIPFFFTHTGNSFIFSNTLNALRQDERISDALNDIAIGDYLLFGVNQDLSTTIFRDIQRLPPGHSLTFANGSISIRRYWTPEITSKVRFRDRQSYVERLVELLTCAIDDRLRADRVAVSMSGGLDSTSIAAIARDRSAVHACTVVYDNLIPDEERYYSTAAADHLGIPITHLNADKYSLFDEQARGDMDQAEPFLISPLTGQFNDLLRLCADWGRVALTGWDGDAFMNEPRKPYLAGFRAGIKRLIGRRPPDSFLPEWIDESFAKRIDLRERLKQQHPIDPTRPAASRALNSPMWSSLFEGYHPGATKLDLEVRHPLIDLRLIEFLLAIPPEPWCVDKHILRLAMKERLPAVVVNRPKTALGGDPALQLVRRASVRWLDSFEVSPQLSDFVNLNRRRSIADEQTSDGLWASLRIFALNYWLTNSRTIERRKPKNQFDKIAAASNTSIA